LQHDTSPHEVQVGGRKRQAQTASARLIGIVVFLSLRGKD
jgi:hypothetical protein